MPVISAIWFLLLTVWMLPQNILGLIVLLFNKTRKHDSGVFLTSGKRWGVSLGWVILVGDKIRDIDTCIRHEKGHQVQSKILGPFYLLTVGICSGIHAATHRRGNYYDYWTERWADKIAGIVR